MSCVLMMGWSFGLSGAAEAQTLTVLHQFTGGAEGSSPMGALLRDSAGNLYGTASCYYCAPGPQGYGTIFKLDAAGNLSTLYTFQGTGDGATPLANLIQDPAGNFYGTALAGGTTNQGTVFEFDTAMTFHTLYSFAGYPTDGAAPFGGVVRDSAGNLFGTTFTGGTRAGECGIAFKVTPGGAETILHSFQGLDGCEPAAGLVADGKGNFYGTTAIGGANDGGTAFKLGAAGGESVLRSFDRAQPTASLLLRSGKLYGAGSTGGMTGNGIVFVLSTATPAGGTLYNFGNAPDGKTPTGGLVADAAGNLYGVAFTGGAFNYGMVFKIDTAGHETVLHDFTGGVDGSDPAASLIIDSAGNLYGTTTLGGDTSCFAPNGCGVIFKLTP